MFCFILTSNGQIGFIDGVNYSPPYQIDSSESYIIGSNINKKNKNTYGTRFSFKQGSIWTNVFIYNSTVKQTHKVFTTDSLLIYPVLYSSYFSSTRSGFYNANVSLILRDCIVFSVRKDATNDRFIDDKDPVCLFLTSKSGKSLKQITPFDANVTGWTISLDGKILLVKLQKDKNGDKNFADEDEIIYQLDLNEDFDKIKFYQIM